MTARSRWLLLAAVAICGLVAFRLVADRDRDATTSAPDPTVWFAPQWEDVLGGDSAVPGSQVDVSSLNGLTDVPAADRAQVTNLAFDVATASILGTDHAKFGTYFARNHPLASGAPSPRFCTGAAIHAVSPFLLPVLPSGSFVKVLVVWSAECPNPPVSLNAPPAPPRYVSFLYLARSSALPFETPPSLEQTYNGWAPVRPAQLPGVSGWRKFSASTPEPWETRSLSRCSLKGVEVRLEVAAAFEALCDAAAASGYGLLAVDGTRDPATQQALFDAAVGRYGSENAARARVAYSDGYLCESLHCAGEALDLAPDERAMEWLRATVACVDSGRLVQPPCLPTARPVARLEQYGFLAPHEEHQYHLEFALGTLSQDAELYGDCTPGGVAVRDRVGLIFKCRILEAGLGADLANRAAGEALSVAICTSGLNPGFVSFDGRYVSSANPATGSPDDRTGVFGLSSAVAQRWVPAGESVLSATSNIDAAARVFVEERSWGRWGWEMFACATGDDGITAPVLERP